MKAAVLYGPRDVRVEDIERPDIEDNEILIKVRVCGICGSDLHTYKLGIFPEVGLPIGPGRMILGHEYSGDVVEVGEKVDGVSIGDRVTAVTLGGGMAEYVKVPTFVNGNVFHIPEDISYEEAATNEPLATSLHAVNVASPNEDDTILIMGAGIIGLGVLQVLKAKYSNEVIISDISQKRLGVAKALGADYIFDTNTGDITAQPLQLVDPSPTTQPSSQMHVIDIAFDCVGKMVDVPGIPVIEQLLNIVRRGGKIVIVGAYEEKVELDLNLLMGKGLNVLGSIAYEPHELAEGLELIRSGKVNRDILISRQFSLDKAAEAFESQLKGGETIRILISP